MGFAIETEGLTKLYGDVRAVEAVDLQIAEGEIFGFIGLNGAGKTTTIRSLLGMIRPTAGTVRLLGHPIDGSHRGPWDQVGHLVEAPAAYPELTTIENLEISRQLQGVVDKSRPSQMIEQLGLGAYADRKAGTLSMGNLQRLGLARAFLHSPNLVILDEPSNGLDPAGVVEIRELLIGLARDEGVTVFMSSHILMEVDRYATRIGIIHEGHLIEELDADSLAKIRAKRLEIIVGDDALAIKTLTEAGYQVDRAGDTLFIDDSRAVEAPEDVATLLVTAGAPPSRLAVVQEKLEDHFLRLTGRAA